MSSSLSPFQHLIASPFNYLFIYDFPSVSLITLPKTHIYHNLFNHTKYKLLAMPNHVVNYLFMNFIYSQFLDYCLIFTDSSVSSNSAGFSYFIPSLNIKFSDVLLQSFPFTIE